MHSLLDWLALIAALIAIEGVFGLVAIAWLGWRVAAQFRKHDIDLRSEVVQVNINICTLIAEIRRLRGSVK